MINPPPYVRPNNPVITPYSDVMAGLSAPGNTTPASGAWTTASMARLFPIYLPEPFPVAKSFWTNGATYGTDQIDIGVYLMTDQVTGRCDLLRSTGPNFSGYAVNVVQEAGIPQAVCRNVTASNSSTDATTYTTATIHLSAGKLYLFAVENSHGTGATAVSSIDNGPTFTSRSTTQYNTSLNRVSIWSAIPSVDYTGTLVINFGATTQTGCCWVLDEVSGADTASADGIVQQAVGTGNSTTALATLGAPSSVYNTTYGAHGHAAATATAPGFGFAELADQTTATPAQALETEWLAGADAGVDASFTSAQWGSCAVEIKADTAPTTYPWRIARANLTASFSDADATSYATASVTLKAGRLYLIAVENTHGSSATAVSAVTGGPTFTSRSTTQFNSNLNRMSIWSAVPTTDYTGTLTIDFGATTQTSCIWSLTEFSGVDTTTNDGIVQNATGTGNTANPKADLSAFGSRANSTFQACASVNSAAHTAGIGFSQLSTTASATPAARMSTEVRVDDAMNAATAVTSSQWGVCAVELKCDTSQLVIPAQIPGNPNVYMAMVINGTTATIFRITPGVIFQRMAGVLEKASGFPLPSTLTAVVAGPGNRPLAGFSLRSLLG